MDLSVSPDVEAYVSYLVVLLAGGFAAKQQISRRLGAYPGIWWVGQTWLLFATYIAIPLLLFWLLDRTAAINDTSLFAAIIVAFGYERILSGSDNSIQVSEGVSSLWNPIMTYLESLVTRITQKQMISERRLAHRIIGKVVENEERFNLFKQIASSHSPDIPALETNLQEIDDKAATIGEERAREQKAQILYNELLTVDDYLFELKERGIIDAGFYFWHCTPWKGRILTLLVAAGLLAIISNSIAHYVDQPRAWNAYYTWRITKPQTSEADLFRARDKLSTQLRDPAIADRSIREIIHVLRKPSLPMDRVELIQAMLLENRCHAAEAKINLPLLLLDSLNADNVDVRERINQMLIFFAEKDRENPGKEIQNWKPANGDSAIDLQRHIATWKKYWSQQSHQNLTSLLCDVT